MNTHARTVQQRFGGEAQNWNGLYTQSQTRSIYTHNVKCRKQQALQFLNGVKGRVLEIGCGAGNVILSASDNGISTFGADFSIDMLHQAKANASEQSKTIPLIAADALQMPFSGDVFDAILCLGVLDYIPNCKSVLKECHRILAPGGQLIVSVPNLTSPFIQIDDLGFKIKNTVTHSLPTRLRTWLKTRILKKEDKPYFSHKKRRYNPRSFTTEMENLGFQIEKTHYHTYGFGLLNSAGFNLKLSQHLESRAGQSRTLETFGWTYILKTKKLLQP